MAIIAAGLNGIVISNFAYQAFRDTLAPLVTFATDFGGEVTRGNQTVHIPLYAANANTTDFAGDYRTGSNGKVNAVPVVIDKHKYNTVDITDVQAANSPAADLQEFGVQAGYDLALKVFQDILSVVTAANYGAAGFTGASGAFNVDAVVDVKNACDGNKMPKVGRNLLLNDEYYNALLKDSDARHQNTYGSAMGIQGGTINPLVGFTTWQTDAIPANAENLVGFAAVRDAIAVAMRYLTPVTASAYDSVGRRQDPDSGIVMGFRQWGEPESGKTFLTLEANYGFNVGMGLGTVHGDAADNTPALVRLVSGV